MLALEGIKILDLSAGYPSAAGTWLLGDLGAEVINIEGRIGIGEPVNSEEKKRWAAYDVVNRNKKSIGLNLKMEEARQIFYRLAETADVVLEPFRPGVAKRLGIDYEVIAKINPKIIYCSMSGYGQDGPYHDLPGHDINYISMGGALGLIGEANGPPIIPLNFVADCTSTLYATIGILTALVARYKTGKGQYIDISYTDTVVSLLAPKMAHYFRENIVLERGKFSGGGAYPYYNIYETNDGKFISIGCMEARQWQKLCKEIGREDFIPFHHEPRFFFLPPEGEKWQEISSYLRNLFITKSRDEWFDLLSQKDIPVGKVYSLDEVCVDPQTIHRRMIIEMEHPTEGKIKQVGIAIKLSDTPGSIRSLAPVIGEHTEKILTDLGYTLKRIDELRNLGVIK